MNERNLFPYELLPDDWEATGLPFSLGRADASRLYFEDVPTMIPEPIQDWIAKCKWDWFFTVTARHELTSASARRVAERIPKRIQRAGCGSPSPSAFDGRLVWVAEPHKHASKGYHLHGLYKRPHPRFAGWTNRREFLFLLNVMRGSVGGEPWRNSAGDLGLWHRCRIEPYKGRSGAEYCAKYITKTIVDWDVHKIRQVEI